VYWVESIGLWGELTPPPAISLIWLAPCLNCSRSRAGPQRPGQRPWNLKEKPRGFSLSRSQQMKVRGVGGHQQNLRCRRHERMPVRVNQARHQTRAAAMTRTPVFVSTVIGGADMRSVVLPLTSTSEGA
jgi:hypothetical protein